MTGRDWLSPSQHQRPQPPLQHSTGVRPLTLAEQCARSGLLTQLPGWLQQQVRASDTGSDTSEHDAAGTPDHAGTRRLVLHALDLLDPELSLGPDRLDDELSRDEHGQPPDDPGADDATLLDQPGPRPERAGAPFGGAVGPRTPSGPRDTSRGFPKGGPGASPPAVDW